MKKASLILLITLLAIGPAACPLTLLGANAKDDDLKRKSEEVEQLKDQLKRAQDELKQLRQDNQELQKEKSQARPAEVKPSRPLTDLPAVTAETALDARDVVAYFKTDAAAAGQRFNDKFFRVRGRIAAFEWSWPRKYYIVLESPDAVLKAAFAFGFPNAFDSVVTRQKKQTLVGVKPNAPETVLHRVGDEVTLRGRCDGLEGATVIFSRCLQEK